MKSRRSIAALLISLVTLGAMQLQAQPAISFVVVPDLPLQTFHVSMTIRGINRDTLLLKMPAWTPGYYQLLHFADQVSGFEAKVDQTILTFTRSGRNGWKIPGKKAKAITVKYDVKATRSFVAVPFLNSERGYIAPTGVFMHVTGEIQCPVSVEILLPEGWIAATGLGSVKNSVNKFNAPDFDILYDSPILMGPLEELPAFDVRGIKHRFIGYKPGDFDRAGFMSDMKKIVEAGVAVIGEIPYKQYTFLAIGPGPGGIEHLNSTTFGFSSAGLGTEDGKRRMYTFLAHEYFHHYNVKRIRPVELGPFDYDKENRTNMLWVSEGITVYYDILLVRRAGLMTDEQLLEGLRGRLLGYENKPGRLYQSATQASYNTWSDGPFGRSDDEVNKTVSVYDKGAILGLMLDFRIRHDTENKKSLDDVMQFLYQDYYLRKKRGFTEQEFQSVCEGISGTKLGELFEYASTVKSPDYAKYFGYGGLSIDTELKEVNGAWLGISTRQRNDSLVVSNVEYQSPAWNAGIRRKMVLLQFDGEPASPLEPMLEERNEGEQVRLQIFDKGQVKDFGFQLGRKAEPNFKVSFSSNPSPLQKSIRESWVTGLR